MGGHCHETSHVTCGAAMTERDGARKVLHLLYPDRPGLMSTSTVLSTFSMSLFSPPSPSPLPPPPPSTDRFVQGRWFLPTCRTDASRRRREIKTCLFQEIAFFKGQQVVCAGVKLRPLRLSY